mmetsp:Transcript_32029/g.91908  ORF Transcript_32029/g.91908 Transcript_32029/m.91908 type:complete len:314 (+) Transcript_32029:201-1142(+)
MPSFAAPTDTSGSAAPCTGASLLSCALSRSRRQKQRWQWVQRTPSRQPPFLLTYLHADEQLCGWPMEPSERCVAGSSSCGGVSALAVPAPEAKVRSSRWPSLADSFGGVVRSSRPSRPSRTSRVSRGGSGQQPEGTGVTMVGAKAAYPTALALAFSMTSAPDDGGACCGCPSTCPSTCRWPCGGLRCTGTLKAGLLPLGGVWAPAGRCSPSRPPSLFHTAGGTGVCGLGGAEPESCSPRGPQLLSPGGASSRPGGRLLVIRVSPPLRDCGGMNAAMSNSGPERAGPCHLSARSRPPAGMAGAPETGRRKGATD